MRGRRGGAGERIALALLACGTVLGGCGNDSDPPRAEDVARALFAALMQGAVEPLAPFLMTNDEAANLLNLTDEGKRKFKDAVRDRYAALIAHRHRAFDIDWASAEMVQLVSTPEGGGVKMEYRIHSRRGGAVVVLKVGVTQAGAKAASSHTGSLAGADMAYWAAFKRSGVIRAETFEALFDYALAFSFQPIPP